MEIALPGFEGGYCQLVTACGELLGSKAQIKSIRTSKSKVARYRTQSGTALVRAWLSGKRAHYLHVDCALREYFPKDNIPKVTHKKAEVMSIIERALGYDIDVGIVGCFEVPMTKLPEGAIIRLLSEEQKTANISMKMTNGTFLLTGAPIRRIDWGELKDEKSVLHVKIQGDIRSTVSEKYMCEMWDWINTQFKLFVLGKSRLEKT